MRVIAQLIEAESDRHVWAERYDRPLGDVFAVQDELSQAIVGQLVGWHGALSSSIRQTARRQRPTDLKANDLYLLGVESQHKFTPEGHEEAARLLEQAVALDPALARAWAKLAMLNLAQGAFGWSSDPAASMEKFVAKAKQTGELDHADPLVLAVLAIAYATRMISSGAGSPSTARLRSRQTMPTRSRPSPGTARPSCQRRRTTWRW